MTLEEMANLCLRDVVLEDPTGDIRRSVIREANEIFDAGRGNGRTLDEVIKSCEGLFLEHALCQLGFTRSESFKDNPWDVIHPDGTTVDCKTQFGDAWNFYSEDLQHLFDNRHKIDYVLTGNNTWQTNRFIISFKTVAKVSEMWTPSGNYAKHIHDSDYYKGMKVMFARSSAAIGKAITICQ